MMRELLLAAVFSGLALLLVAVTWAIYQRSKARRAVRARYFSEVAALFEAPLNAVAATGFPRLSGKINGALFDLQVVPDTLTFRKLPALWLLVTLPEPLPLRATLDMLMRPMGTEPFTNHSKLPQQIATPAGFPPDCVIRTDDPQALPDAALVARHVAGLNPDRLKEVVISPKGLRIVWLIEEADRTRYLLFRDAEMGATPLPRTTLLPLIGALRDLQADLTAELAKE